MRIRFLTVLPVVVFVLTLVLAGPAWSQADPDLDISKSDNLDPVDTGDLLVYTIEVTNEGSTPLDTNDVEIIDNLPLARVDFDSVDANEFRCKRSGGSVRCELRAGETLGSRETEDIEIVVEADKSGTAKNTAIVRAGDRRIDTDTESTRIDDSGNNGGRGGGGGGGGGGGTPTNPTNTVTPTQDTTSTTPSDTANLNTANPDTTAADANLNADFANRPDSGSFRCDLFLRTVRDEGGALRDQYTGNEAIVQRFEQCLSENVLADTIPNRALPFTGGMSLIFLAAIGLAAIVAGVSVLRAVMRRER